jgi:predicted alpha/beta superfamily hydrolase
MNKRISSLIFVIFGIIIHLQNIPALGCEYLESCVSTVKIYSLILGKERKISIALPPGYEDEQSVYPILYVLDAEGHTVFPDCVATAADLHSKGLIPKMIIVGIWNTDRNRDMIPAKVSHRPGSGGSIQFLSFIKEELMSYIKQNYHTTDFSMLYGMSNSALFVVYALLEQPKTFSAYIASSPMIGHCPEFIQKKTELLKIRDRLEDRTLYMIYGTEDSRRVTTYVPEFQKYLKTNTAPSFSSYLEILEGQGHVPKSSLERGLRYIFSKK